MIKKRNLDPSLRNLIEGCGLMGSADVFYVTTGTAGAAKAYWDTQTGGVNKYTSLSDAHDATTSARNDVVLVSPESHTQTSSLTWSHNMTHMIGMYPSALMNHRARIGHSANFNKLLDITGYGCLFANIYLMYGRGSATNVTAVQVTGNRNTFYNVHVGAPMNATEADEATFKVMQFSETTSGDGLEHYLNHCVIGVDTVAWTNGVMFRTYGTPRLVFEDCMFLMNADNAQVMFIDGTAGDGEGFVLFKNCTGINRGSALTYAIGSTGLASATDYIIHNSGFSGVTDLIAAADEAQVKGIASVGAAADDINIGLAIDYDHTA